MRQCEYDDLIPPGRLRSSGKLPIIQLRVDWMPAHDMNVLWATILDRAGEMERGEMFIRGFPEFTVFVALEEPL